MAKQKALFDGPLGKLEKLAEQFMGFKKDVENAQDEKNKVEEQMIIEMHDKKLTSFQAEIDGQKHTFKVKYQSAREKIKVEI